jgi:hypothetical protein
VNKSNHQTAELQDGLVAKGGLVYLTINYLPSPRDILQGYLIAFKSLV